MLRQEIGQSPGHPRPEVDSGWPQHSHYASGHIFASVLTHSFHHGEGAAVAHRETFTGCAGDIQLPGSCAVKHGIAGQDIAAQGGIISGIDSDYAAAQSFPYIIISFAREMKGDSGSKKGSETWPRRPVKAQIDGRGFQICNAEFVNHIATQS